MRNFEYVMPRTVAEAATAGAREGAALKGAGTDLLERMKEGVSRPGAIVNLLAIKDLGAIVKDGDVVRVGALATLADVAADATIRKFAQGLADAAADAATPQIRNRATVGGNLAQRPRCWYFRNDTYDCTKKGGSTCFAIEGENKYHAIFRNKTCAAVHPSNLAPALWALDAVVHVTKNGGGIADVPIADFWVAPETDVRRECALDPGHVITGVSLRAQPAASGSAYLETREKLSFDWALASAACSLVLDGDVVRDVRVVASAVAPVPMRLEAVEQQLRGKAFTPALAAEAASLAAKGATPLRDNNYKINHLTVIVRRALERAYARAKGESR